MGKLSYKQKEIVVGLVGWILAIILTIWALSIVGCRRLRESDYDKADRTPDGWHVEYDDQGSSAYWSTADVYRDFDRRMREIGSPYAGGILYILVDNTRFWVDSAQAWASGMYTGTRIYVAVYPDQSLTPGSEFPSDSLPWTRHVGTVTGNLYFGVWPPEPSFPALEHELEHAAGARH